LSKQSTEPVVKQLSEEELWKEQQTFKRLDLPRSQRVSSQCKTVHYSKEHRIEQQMGSHPCSIQKPNLFNVLPGWICEALSTAIKLVWKLEETPFGTSVQLLLLPDQADTASNFHIDVDNVNSDINNV